jgi:hypothetical protein
MRRNWEGLRDPPVLHAGPKGKHHSPRGATGHGCEQGSVVLGPARDEFMPKPPARSLERPGDRYSSSSLFRLRSSDTSAWVVRETKVTLPAMRANISSSARNLLNR